MRGDPCDENGTFPVPGLSDSDAVEELQSQVKDRLASVNDEARAYWEHHELQYPPPFEEELELDEEEDDSEKAQQNEEEAPAPDFGALFG